VNGALLFASGVLALGILQGCRQPALLADPELRALPTSTAVQPRPTTPPVQPRLTSTPSPAPTPVPNPEEQVQSFLDEAEFTYHYRQSGGGAIYAAEYKDDFLKRYGLTFDVNGTAEPRTGIVLRPLKFFELPPFSRDDESLPSSWHATEVLEPGSHVSWIAEITMRDTAAGKDLGVIIARAADPWSRYEFEFARLAWFPDDVYVRPD
jgi:hypothetical protein